MPYRHSAAHRYRTFETVGSGPWTHFTLLPCGPHAVPTIAPELRLITELRRNRPDRYGPIIQHMQRNGCDLDIIHRGIVNAGLPQVMQEDLIRRLGSGIGSG